MATCSPRGFPEMPRTNGSLRPDTSQGRARSVTASCREGHRGRVTAGKTPGGPWQRGLRRPPAAQLNPKALSRLISAEGLPAPPMGHHPQTLRRPGPFLRALGCDSVPDIWACPPEGDPRQADLGRSCTLIPMKLLSQKSNPSCVRSALGQAGAHSSVTLKLRLRCGRKPHVPMLPERDWDLGLRVPVRKKLLSPQELQTESW